MPRAKNSDITVEMIRLTATAPNMARKDLLMVLLSAITIPKDEAKIG